LINRLHAALSSPELSGKKSEDLCILTSTHVRREWPLFVTGKAKLFTCGQRVLFINGLLNSLQNDIQVEELLNLLGMMICVNI
jgi:hypothetical protein